MGPTVCELDGPMPILNRSNADTATARVSRNQQRSRHHTRAARRSQAAQFPVGPGPCAHSFLPRTSCPPAPAGFFPPPRPVLSDFFPFLIFPESSPFLLLGVH